MPKLKSVLGRYESHLKEEFASSGSDIINFNGPIYIGGVKIVDYSEIVEEFLDAIGYSDGVESVSANHNTGVLHVKYNSLDDYAATIERLNFGGFKIPLFSKAHQTLFFKGLFGEMGIPYVPEEIKYFAGLEIAESA